jgi:hypothetical protein
MTADTTPSLVGNPGNAGSDSALDRGSHDLVEYDDDHDDGRGTALALAHTAGTAPVPRNGHTLVAADDGRLVMFGGWNGAQRIDDLDVGSVVARRDTSKLALALCTEAFADVVVQCDDGVRFAAHSFVLEARSR